MDRYKLALLSLVCAVCLGGATIQQRHRAVLSMNRGAAAPACDLLEDTMENTDGTNATVHGWTADGTDPGDDMEIDTAFAQAGGSSMYKGDDANANLRNIYKAIAAQTTGKWTVSMYFYRQSVTASNNQIVVQLSAGSLANFAVSIRSLGAQIQYDSGGGTFVALCTGCVSANTWTRLEIEMDQDTNTFDAWRDTATQIGNDIAFTANVDPDRFYLRKQSTGSTNTNMWIDTICVKDGAR